MISNVMSKSHLVCQLGMAGINFKHNRVDLCYRSRSGTEKKYTTITEAVNDEELCRQRLQLLNGEWPSACYDCKYMEDQGAESYRERIILDQHKSTQYWLDNVDAVTGKVKTLRRIEFRFANTCNYVCRHCSPEYSSVWSKTVKNNPILGTFDGMEIPQYPESYSNNLEDLSEVGNFIDETLEIEVTGGEPFFQKKFYECLEQLKPFAHKIKFIVTTNGSIAGKFKNYDIQSLLEPFKEVYLKVSMDGSRSFYNYFRQGGDWDRVMENMNSFKQLPNLRLAPFVTIANMQAARMPEIYNDFKEINSNPKWFEAGEVIHPDFLNPVHLPQPLKERYLKEWEDFTDGLSNSSHAERIGRFAIAMLESNKSNPNAWKTFCAYSDQLDKIHNKNIFDYFPEWEEFWHKSS